SDSGGLLEWSLGLRESNLLGLGKEVLVEAGREERDDFWGCGYSDPRLFGARLSLVLRAAFGARLDLQELNLRRAFESAAYPWGFTIDARRFSGPVVDHRGGIDGPEWSAETRYLSGTIGLRVRGNEYGALRLSPLVYLLSERYEEPPDSLRTLGGSGSAAEPFRDREIRAVGVGVEMLRERFRQLSRIDGLGRWEDIDLGGNVEAGIGPSLRRWGARRDALFITLRAQQGVDLGPGRLLLASLQGLGQVRSGRTDDAWLEVRARYYDQVFERHTLAAGLRGTFGGDLAPQDLPTLGAHTGLRGFKAHRFWGDHAVVANLEDRLLVVEDLFGLVSIGLAGFVDAGTTWQAGQHQRARPRICAGLGLRLQSRRAGGPLVTRVDVAHPLEGGDGDDGWVLSFATGQAF
ncbi:MAG: BamA/TamA family outer membrane protein, partial [Candidatus Eisenbacteria bacterium]